MKKICLFLSCFMPMLSYAQPTGYYNSAIGKTGEALRIALYDIVKGHVALSYTPGLWNAYYTTDVKSGTSKLYTLYSDKPGSTSPYEFTIGTQQCSGSSPSGEGGCYNREHTWPQSKFGSANPMYTDLWIVYPTDYYVNSQRADNPYGMVTSPTRTFQNGSKLGPNVYAGAPTSTAYEPIDSFKGDIARTYFYIATRYYGDSASFSDWEMASKSTLKPWAIQMLLEWNHNDPVSAKEKARNEAAYLLQKNRNPFIDNPQYADCIWGNCIGLGTGDVAVINSNIRVFPNPASTSVNICLKDQRVDEVLSVDLINVQGQITFHSGLVNDNTIKIDLSEKAKGIYFLHVRTARGVVMEKIVVQ